MKGAEAAHTAALSRDHTLLVSAAGLVTITGGKATTCRAMAETTVDVVCQKLGIKAACTTKEVVLASYRDYYLAPEAPSLGR